MIENLEFWALLIGIVGGDICILFQNQQLKSEICNNAQKITELKADTEKEFAKCRVHACNTQPYKGD